MSASHAVEGGSPEERRSASPNAGALASVAVLIPAWDPEATLGALVSSLLAQGFGLIVVVDDGSRTECSHLFAELTAFARTEVLHHAENLGKGCALKTGFRHLLDSHPAMYGVVTADADGQHTPADVERIAYALLGSSSRPVLGSRAWERNVPLRSRVGNLLTRQIFRLLTGVSLADTQTGLRGLPHALLPELLALPGRRYEYEMVMLVHLCRSGQLPLEVPIATVYLENNRGSHFHPVWDSVRIYSVLLGFYARRLFGFRRSQGART